MNPGHDDLLALALPFDKSVESTMTKGGARLTYIPVSEVINRLNEVLAYNWSYTVQSCHRDPLDPDYVVAHVTLKVYLADSVEPVSVRDGFGGVRVKRTRDGGIVDLGDEYKGAVSDALKKAAQSFGVGLYLARHDDVAEEYQPDTAPFVLQKTYDGTLKVKGKQHGPIPEWAIAAAAEQHITEVYDNRDTLHEHPTRPWFKCTQSKAPIWAPRNTPLPLIDVSSAQPAQDDEEPF